MLGQGSSRSIARGTVEAQMRKQEAGNSFENGDNGQSQNGTGCCAIPVPGFSMSTTARPITKTDSNKPWILSHVGIRTTAEMVNELSKTSAAPSSMFTSSFMVTSLSSQSVWGGEYRAKMSVQEAAITTSPHFRARYSRTNIFVPMRHENSQEAQNRKPTETMLSASHHVSCQRRLSGYRGGRLISNETQTYQQNLGISCLALEDRRNMARTAQDSEYTKEATTKSLADNV